MGIRLDEKNLADFFNLFLSIPWVVGINSNTIHLLWSNDPNAFIDAELKKLKVGLNIFTGPLAKTFMDKISSCSCVKETLLKLTSMR